MLLLSIAVGGALGALARFGLTSWILRMAGGIFPWGTLAVNLIGSFLLGFLARLMESTATNNEVRGLVAVGFLGAFTTFSTFSYETVSLLQAGEWARGVAYALGSMILGLAGVLGGMTLANVLRLGT